MWTILLGYWSELRGDVSLSLHQKHGVHLDRRDLWPSDSWSGLARISQVVSPALPCAGMLCFGDYRCCPMGLGRAGSIPLICQSCGWVMPPTQTHWREWGRFLGVLLLAAEGSALVNWERVGVASLLFWGLPPADLVDQKKGLSAKTSYLNRAHWKLPLRAEDYI